MNNATLAFLPNVSLLFTCCYISAFSSFFTTKDLMTINERNQAFFVINALLFEYLNKSKNESMSRHQLFLLLLNETHFYQKDWNATLGLKHGNETYQYTITASLLHHCQNITGYLSRYANRKERITSPVFTNTLHEILLNQFINNNPCFTINGSTKLTPVRIEKLLECIWSAYNQERISSGISNDIKKEEMTKLKRFRRHPPIYTNNSYTTDDEIESITNTEPDAVFYFNNEQLHELLSFLHDSENFSNTVSTHGEYINDQTNVSDVSIHTAGRNLDRSQQNEVQNLPNILETSENIEVGNKRLNSEEDSHIQTKNQKVDTGSSSSTINTNYIDNDLDFDNIPSTSKETPTSILLKYINFEMRKQASKESLEMADDGKSKRMLSIEVAAKFICSCVPRRSFTDIVDMLKGFLLKLEESTTVVPTYDKLARDYCDNLSIPLSYNAWKIPNHTFIDDVLFNSYFDGIDTSDLARFYKWKTLSRYPVESLKNDLKMYQSSIKLRKSLRIQDFLLMRMHLLHSTRVQSRKTAEAIERIKAVLYRLALRECEEDWIEENITLYAINFDKNLRDLRTNSSSRRDYTFNKYIEFSVNLSEEISKLEELSIKTSHLVLYTIELENQAGIVSIGRLFEANTSRRYMVPINMSFVIRQARPINIGKKKVFSIEMRDERLKEKKMIDMVEKLYNLFKYSSVNLFD